jgi:HAMP domain-containing protein
VTLQENAGKLFLIVSGSRRVSAARTAGLDSVPARIVGREIDERDLFFRNIRENADTRTMNDLERALVLHRLIEDFGAGEKEALGIMPALALASSRRILYQYTSLVRLTDELKRYVVSHTIPIRISSRVAEWATGDQEALSGLFKTVTLSGNNLKDLLDLIEEISLRDDVAIRKVLAMAEAREVLEESRFTSTQKREMLKQRLFHIRYPVLSERTERISMLLKKGGDLSGISLTPPPYLEGSSLNASFSFGSVEKLRKAVDRLNLMANGEEIGKVLKLLSMKRDDE